MAEHGENMIPAGIELSSGTIKPSSAYELSRQKSRQSGTYEPREVERPRKMPSNWVIAGGVSMLLVGLVSSCGSQTWTIELRLFQMISLLTVLCCVVDYVYNWSDHILG